MEKAVLLHKCITKKKMAIIVFALYFFVGMLIFSHYGISTDEQMERTTSLVNYAYVMERLFLSSDNETVVNVFETTPHLYEWRDRFYGTFLGSLTVIVEHLMNFELPTRTIFLMRHAFTFINYFVSGIFFYLVLVRRFGHESYIPLIGVLFFILSPRFFGESFYNIKDIMFYSWCIISSYFVLRWLEDKEKRAFTIPAAFTLAVATNTRILGISILLLAGGFVFIEGLRRREYFLTFVKRWSILCLFTFIFFVFITPFTWANPLKNTIDIFFHFLRFQPWDGTHFYMGQMIGREVPWHYIPVWMGITIPLLYIALFFVGITKIASIGFKFIFSLHKQKEHHKIELPQRNTPPHLYDLFFASMFIFTLLGYIFLGVNMYEGWRHAYSIYLPFLYVAVTGLSWAASFFAQKQLLYRIGFSCIIAASLLHSSVWSIVNHPYQYVYFNVVGRQFAERNFALDYWNVSTLDMVRYTLDLRQRPVTNINFHFATVNMLTAEERRQIVRTDNNKAQFVIVNSRLSYDDRVRGPGEGFAEIAAIAVDSMRIVRLFERTLPFEASYDFNAWSQIVGMESNTSDNFHFLHDGNSDTIWTTHRPQESGDYIQFEFSEPVNYNFFYLNHGNTNNAPKDLAIYISPNGEHWQSVPIEVFYNMYFIFEAAPYKFIRLEIKEYNEEHWWSIIDMNFGYAHLTSSN